MSTGAKFLIGTIAGFLAVAYSWIFRARKVQSSRHELGERPGEPRRPPGELDIEAYDDRHQMTPSRSVRSVVAWRSSSRSTSISRRRSRFTLSAQTSMS